MTGWDDPGYRAALDARTEAYSEMWRVALENPHKFESPEWQAFFDTHVVPVRDVFFEAEARLKAVTERIAEVEL